MKDKILNALFYTLIMILFLALFSWCVYGTFFLLVGNLPTQILSGILGFVTFIGILIMNVQIFMKEDK